jgi:two-component system, NarL family, response regulator NreC
MEPVPAAPAPTATEPIRVVVADDHAVVRAGLSLLLESSGRFAVVAEAGDVEAARRYVLGHKPDVVVLDLNMPGEATLPAIPDLAEHCAVVVLTMQAEADYALRALQHGALGYVLKDSAYAHLHEAVAAAARGEMYVDPAIGARLAVERRTERRALPGALTPREVDVLRLVAVGYTNKQIAAELGMSVRTAEAHRAHIQRKLTLSSRADLVRYAVEHDLIRIEFPPPR